MGEKVCQFKGFMQQDAQEFMAFLLDGLHEVKVVNNFFLEPPVGVVERNLSCYVKVINIRILMSRSQLLVKYYIVNLYAVDKFETICSKSYTTFGF